MYACSSFHLWSGVSGTLIDRLGLGWWGVVLLALPLLVGFATTRLASRDTSVPSATPAGQGVLAAVSATGTGVLVVAALAAVTIAIAPQKVPLQTPAPPAGGGCETCGADPPTIPPALRHDYWVGISIAQAARGPDDMLLIAPIFALFTGLLGTGIAAASLSTDNPRLRGQLS
jgi:hypothetical protein